MSAVEFRVSGIKRGIVRHDLLCRCGSDGILTVHREFVLNVSPMGLVAGNAGRERFGVEPNYFLSRLRLVSVRYEHERPLGGLGIRASNGRFHEISLQLIANRAMQWHEHKAITIKCGCTAYCSSTPPDQG